MFRSSNSPDSKRANRSEMGNAPSISDMLEEIETIMADPRSGKNVHDRLWKALGRALNLHLEMEKNPRLCEEFMQICQDRGTKVRSGAHPLTALVKLCFPGRKARDYSRYANALANALEEAWDGKTLFKQLRARGRGGLTALALNNSTASNPASALDRFDERWKRRHKLAEIEIEKPGDAPNGAILLLAERADTGSIRIYEVLDSEQHQIQAGKLFRKLWQTRKARKTHPAGRREPT